MMQNSPVPRQKQWEKVAGFLFGIIFIGALLALNVFIPKPTPTQYDTFKIVLALAAAGVAGILAGFLHVEGGVDKLKLRAGGALAVFSAVFLISPAAPPAPASIVQNIHGTNGSQVVKNNGTINIDQSTNKELPKEKK